jgi:NAD(P)-dependent dehydrogenase (short-subunit alcohol dehydrogenase family)
MGEHCLQRPVAEAMGKVIQLCQWYQLWAFTFIINVSSIAALVGGNSDYRQTVGHNSSKGAVISMTQDLATS